MEVLNASLDNYFFECVSSAKNNIKLCSPFVKKSTIESIYRYKEKNVSLQLVTKVNLHNYYCGASDITALELINRSGGKIFNLQKLHSKIYIFDDTRSIITSANLTPSGLMHNFEYGVLIDESEHVTQIVYDYEQYLESEYSHAVTKTNITDIKSILSEFPKIEKTPLLDYHFEANDICDSEIDRGLLEQNIKLVGWKKSVIEVLNTLSKDIFTTEDYIPLLATIQKIYPNAKTPEATFRRTLQELRDIGLIKFEKRGFYRKLWKSENLFSKLKKP